MNDDPHADQAVPAASRLTGRVRKYHSNFYYVECGGRVYESMLRGLIKKQGVEVLVGDYVIMDSVDGTALTARIHEVLPRKNAISRPKMANVDQALIVYSLREPQFDPAQMDRYLTHVELAGITPILCISKSDLAKNPQELAEVQALYAEKLGYEVLLSSIRQPERLQAIRARMAGKITVLAGPSGSGKSSLLNALHPALQLRVGEVSEKIARGQHTTRHVELLSLPSSAEQGAAETWIADTPGFSNLKFNYVLPGQIERAYRDFAPYRLQCAFSDCLHRDEEGCAVRAHLADIPTSRYESYLALLAEAWLFKEEFQATSQKEAFGIKRLDRKGKEALQIVRLKEKNRDASRRTARQQVGLLDTEDIAPADWPETDLPDVPH